MNKFLRQKGFTLIEVIMAVIISGIIGTIALRSTTIITESGRIETTKDELLQIGYAITGNDILENNGIRTDFGYIGDIGSFPPNLDALYQNPGGYATWNGPYIKNRFGQLTEDFKRDAWNIPYTFTAMHITSSGSGSDIVHTIGNGTSDFLINNVSGLIFDKDGTPPGSLFQDSLMVELMIPNGAGNFLTKVINPDIGGYFSFDSIPIGNHDLQIIYTPSADTLKRFALVIPNSDSYNEYVLPRNYWYSASSGTGGLTFVPGTATTLSSPQCNGIQFDLVNNSASTIMISSLMLSFTSPTAYYQSIDFKGSAFDSSNPKHGSDEITMFNTPSSVAPGETVSVLVEGFKSNVVGGPNVDMSNVDFDLTFSDGSVISFTSGSCP